MEAIQTINGSVISHSRTHYYYLYSKYFKLIVNKIQYFWLLFKSYQNQRKRS
jgi:hypothetical protein